MSAKSAVGIILILFGVAVAVNAYSTAAVTSSFDVSIVEPAEALLADEQYPVTVVAGHTVTTTMPIKLHNRLADSVKIESLTVVNNPRIQVHRFTPAELQAFEEAFLSVTYIADTSGGQYPVTHKLVAHSTKTDVELTFDVEFTVLNELVVQTIPEDAGTVDGETTYLHDTTAVVTATPNTCYTFTGWDGDVPASQRIDNPLHLTMDANKDITALFHRTEHELIVDPSEGGTVDPSGSTTYACGSDVTITATPEVGYRFSGWEGDVDGGEQITISLYSDVQIRASFEPISDTDTDSTDAEIPAAREEQGN